MKRLPILLAGMLLSVAFPGARAHAQSLEAFGVGATVGLSSSIDHEFRLQNFDTHDANLWVQYQLEEGVLLRGTFGSMKVRGHNAGQPAVINGGAAVALPDLRDRMDYATLSVSYEFHANGWETGLFGGVGGYQIRPEPVNTLFAPYRDQRETVWGLHLGVDTDFQIWRRLSGIARITYHVPQSSRNKRQILTANAGLLYRF